jgi:hypothetical protein
VTKAVSFRKSRLDTAPFALPCSIVALLMMKTCGR